METLKKRSAHRQPHKRTFYFYVLSDESFWSGMASALDLFGQFRAPRCSRDPWEADFEALHGDWKAIGQDLTNAIHTFEVRHRKALAKQERLFDPDDTTRTP